MVRATRSWTTRRAARAALLLALLLPAAGRTPPAAAGPTSGPTARAAGSAASRGVRGSAPQAAADSVLAVVGTARPGGPVRVIGRRQFARAWVQTAPPARPDSLTPAAARQFLDLLVDKEALALAAGRERWSWTRQESTAFEALADRLVMTAVLDSALAETRRVLGPGAATMERPQVAIVTRDSAMARLRPEFDEGVVRSLARAWSALPVPDKDSSMFVQLRQMGTMPEVAPADTARVVARWGSSALKVSEVLGSWRRLSPLYRPRIESADDMRDLVRNDIFEHMLREQANRRDLRARPDIREQLERQHEFNDVSHFVGREVYTHIPMDSVTLRRFYDLHRADWDLPTRVRLVRPRLPDRAAASAIAARLVNQADAESLAAQARRARVDYTDDVSAQSDSALFAWAMRAGTGAVLGPDSTAEGWVVGRVMAILPGRPRSFDEARTLVEQRWYGEEGERVMQDVVARERNRAGFRIHAAALADLVAHPPEALTAPPHAGPPPR